MNLLIAMLITATVYSPTLGRTYADAAEVCFELMKQGKITIGSAASVGACSAFGAASIGVDATSTLTVTNPSGTVCRHTKVGGTDPALTYDNPGTGAVVYINSDNYSAGNNGYFIVTSSKPDYFEVSNSACVAEGPVAVGATGSMTSRIRERTFGSSTSQFDITKSGSACTYTFDGTGSNPYIGPSTWHIGNRVVISGTNFAAGNNKAGNVIAVATDTGGGTANAFTTYNPTCAAESNKTIGSGSIKLRYLR